MRVALLMLLAAVTITDSVSASDRDIRVRVEPPGPASVCLRQTVESSEIVCREAVAGSVTVELPEAWTFPVLLEVSASGFVPERVIADAPGNHTVILSATREFQWKGWTDGSSQTTLLYLSRDERAWIEAGRFARAQSLAVPAFARALRFMPGRQDQSPVTVFPTLGRDGRRAALLPAHAGGEVAFCVEADPQAEIPFTVTSFSGEPIAEGKTNQQGCLSIPGLTPGNVRVVSTADSHSFETVDVFQKRGESAWLGTLVAQKKGECCGYDSAVPGHQSSFRTLARPGL